MGMFSDLMTWMQRSRLRQRLLRMDERRLEDIGYSRALLEDGVRAWPWRLPVDSIAALGRFEHAVRNGRPGYPEDERRAA